jgi:hypothetical protein
MGAQGRPSLSPIVPCTVIPVAVQSPASRGKEISWERFGRMVMGFEGWQFRFEARPLQRKLCVMALPMLRIHTNLGESPVAFHYHNKTENRDAQDHREDLRNECSDNTEWYRCLSGTRLPLTLMLVAR